MFLASMASRGPRSKLDHETRTRRQKALEAPKEPRRPKTHWDHVLEEMIWLSKDFEAERKWKLVQAKKVALRASRGMLDPATRGEKRMKEEEQRMRKIASNISKDVKKFWTKIEKLVHYKHQLELDDKKKKALDKQLEYLLGQTERYSTMLAENLLRTSNSSASVQPCIQEKTFDTQQREINADAAGGYMELIAETKSNTEIKTHAVEADDDYSIQSEHEQEDDEQTIEEDEALITEEERQEELAALQNEVDLPLEELLKRYSISEDEAENTPDVCGIQMESREVDSNEVNGEDSPEAHGAPSKSPEEVDADDGIGFLATANGCGSPKISTYGCGKNNDPLKKENDVPRAESYDSKNISDGIATDVETDYDFNDEQGDDEFVITPGEEKDDETTLDEEEELAKRDSGSGDPEDEIALLQKESEIPLEELLARYSEDFAFGGSSDEESDYESAHSDMKSAPADQMLEQEEQNVPVAEDNASGEVKLNLSSSGEAMGGQETGSEEGSQTDARIADAAAAARSAQPTGNTFSTTKVRTKLPFLIKHPLREYQHIGLDWLVTMYEKKLNGILADEMGLGKTIMTIALLAHLACEKGIWGPHLIVVPTSVMLNWETEFLKWCPAFKILTYFGSAKERKYKRQGWMKSNSFHVCITTYRLVIQDSKIFKRKKWKYLILDEAHLIKNWKSQRWQTLLNFNSKRRILLTGTPLQNDLMELWSLMHFLMPHVFQSHQEFKDWFCNPIAGMVEGQEKVNKEVVDRLHNVLRPFILRRLKRDVETQLPMKHEHVIYCRLSKRQRNLYEDFIASAETQATLASANFIGMLNVIMQLRKVCNHPDLFEGRPIISSFDMEGIEMQLSSNICSILSPGPFSLVDLSGLGFLFTHLDCSMTSWESDEIQSIATPARLIEHGTSQNNLEWIRPRFKNGKQCLGTNIFEEIQKAIFEERLNEAKERAAAIAWWNSLRCQKRPTYSTTLPKLVIVTHPVYDIQCHKENPVSYDYSSKLSDIVLSPVERFQKMIDQVESFMFAIPAARAPSPVCWCSKSGTSVFVDPIYKEICAETLLPFLTPFRPAIVRRQLYFPDRRLLQFDCGKLQQLAILLRRLKSEGHRALIFTQMTKMLDILEAFINLYGYTYMRLDGSTQPEERQTLMQRFNTNPKIFLFILSTRSGGVGINLVGADTVIFYDSDWNPAMDQQAQDRCHRIGQTREVHIYRLISESTIEENILKKANQKRALDDLVIQSGGYNTEFFKKLDPMELFSGHRLAPIKDIQKERDLDAGVEVPVSNADIEAALKNAEDEADYMALKKVEEEEAVDNQEFTEEAIGRLDDEELANEDVPKADEPVEKNSYIPASNNESVAADDGNDQDREKSLALACDEDDIDMLADVKQMAAAAAASGQAVLSFENQLRPIDRYAMSFLELWDPIIDKNAMEYQLQIEEREWELERIEKLKEDMEAEIDDDDEPLVYEKWDVEFATQAYHQQVEALAQHQLMEELESQAEENKEDINGDLVKNEASSGSKLKPKKKKQKKAKFKSLKKESMASASKTFKEEEIIDHEFSDSEDISQEAAASQEVIMLQRKRKKDETTSTANDESITKSKPKKAKKTAPVTTLPLIESNSLSILHDSKDSRSCEDGGIDQELKAANRGKSGGKISIATMPMKRVYTIKPEKLKKRGSVWSNDCLPSPDFWLPQEDAVLCALVHEYGPNWSLVSDTLYGMTAGGLYRGRFCHPAVCCERFRELVQKYVHSLAETVNNEKASTTGPAKGLLKVNEDNIRILLDAAMEQPDRELLLQRHFTALLTSVWRVTSCLDKQRSCSIPQYNLYSSIRLFGASVNTTSQNSNRGPSNKNFNLRECSNLITTALCNAGSVSLSKVASLSSQMEEDSPPIEKLDVTLEFGRNKDEINDSPVAFPSIVSLSIPGMDLHSPVKMPSEENQLRTSQDLAENRFRTSLSACLHGARSWASSAFPISESKSRSALKSPVLGKHKLAVTDGSRSSKSKVRKVAVEPSEIHSPFAEMLHPLMPIVTPDDLCSTSGSQPPGIPDGSFEDLLVDISSDLNEELPIGEASSLEMVPHCFDPNFISDLGDCSLREYTDVG